MDSKHSDGPLVLKEHHPRHTVSCSPWDGNGAVLSSDGLYRYLLWRTLGFKRWMVFVMCNPSTADASVDDPTIRRCKAFAQREQCDLLVANVCALRATDPKQLALAADPVGPDNAHWLAEAANKATIIVAAWGDIPLLRKLGTPKLPGAVCLGTTKNGAPRHPLYVRGAAALEPWPRAS